MVELADKETELIVSVLACLLAQKILYTIQSTILNLILHLNQAPLIKKEEERSKNGAIENSSNDKESNKSSSFNAQQSDNLNLLEVTSQKEGHFLCSQKFLKRSKYGIFGNHINKGTDQVRPPDLVFSLIAGLFIIFPSGFVLIYT